MEYLEAWGTLIHEKNLKSKISCQTPFKGPTWKVCRVTGTQGSGSEQSGAEWSWALYTTQLSSPGLSSGKLPAKFIEMLHSRSSPFQHLATGFPYSGTGLVFIPVLS
jgi:hypothetical protein